MNLRPKLTYANVMVTLLAVLVLGTGTAWAAAQLGANTVGSKQLKPDAVTASKISDESVRKRALAQPVQNQLDKGSSQVVSRIHLDANATSGATPQPIGTVGSLTLKAACLSSNDETSIVFAIETVGGGRVQENFQNDTGSNPGQPGSVQSGNLQFDLPAGNTVIGGPPGVPDGTFFRTIATITYTSGDETSTLQIAAIADGSEAGCTVDGTGATATG